MVCPHGQGGVEPVRTFCGQGGVGQFFTILYGHLLWAASFWFLGRNFKAVATAFQKLTGNE